MNRLKITQPTKTAIVGGVFVIAAAILTPITYSLLNKPSTSTHNETDPLEENTSSPDDPKFNIEGVAKKWLLIFGDQFGYLDHPFIDILSIAGGVSGALIELANDGDQNAKAALQRFVEDTEYDLIRIYLAKNHDILVDQGIGSRDVSLIEFQLAILAQNNELAIGLAELLMAKYPTDAGVQYFIQGYFRSAGNYTKAVEIADRVIKQAGFSDRTRAVFHFAIGTALIPISVHEFKKPDGNKRLVEEVTYYFDAALDFSVQTAWIKHEYAVCYNYSLFLSQLGRFDGPEGAVALLQRAKQIDQLLDRTGTDRASTHALYGGILISRAEQRITQISPNGDELSFEWLNSAIHELTFAKSLFAEGAQSLGVAFAVKQRGGANGLLGNSRSAIDDFVAAADLFEKGVPIQAAKCYLLAAREANIIGGRIKERDKYINKALGLVAEGDGFENAGIRRAIYDDIALWKLDDAESDDTQSP